MFGFNGQRGGFTALKSGSADIPLQYIDIARLLADGRQNYPAAKAGGLLGRHVVGNPAVTLFAYDGYQVGAGPILPELFGPIAVVA